MKRILITGRDGFIGTALDSWLSQRKHDYSVDRLSLRNDDWTATDLSSYDVIIHAAGIAHVRNDSGIGDEYYRVNRDLTLRLAAKAKKDGIAHFIFLSSIIVYSDGKSRQDLIQEDSLPDPKNAYGRSKLEAEQGLMRLSDSGFLVSVLRLPMVYGKGSKGNFRLLLRLAKAMPFFPFFENRRSMIYIENLCVFIERVVALGISGLLFPQNSEYSSTSHIVKELALIHGRPMILLKGFSPIIKALIGKSNLIAKVFGDLAYAPQLSVYDFDYQIVALDESLRRTEY